MSELIKSNYYLDTQHNIRCVFKEARKRAEKTRFLRLFVVLGRVTRHRVPDFL